MWHGFSGQSGMMYSKIFVNFVKKNTAKRHGETLFFGIGRTGNRNSRDM